MATTQQIIEDAIFVALGLDETTKIRLSDAKFVTRFSDPSWRGAAANLSWSELVGKQRARHSND